MAEFRAYSDIYPFRHRSETPSIAHALSLQPFRAYATDAVIMFSDILTPLPALGLEFDLAPGKGPFFDTPLRTRAQADALLEKVFVPERDLPFVAELLEGLRTELRGEDTALVGFVGAPFTLAAYAVEGAAGKHLVEVKRLMYGGAAGEKLLDDVLGRLARMVGEYMVFQIDHGAQVVQLFDSWAHHLSPAQYARWALPYARVAAEYCKRERPDVPVIFFANGAGGKLEIVREGLKGVVDVFGVDWSVSMADARRRMGKDVVLQGNVDPSILSVGNDEAIKEAVRETVEGAGGNLILNLGHGVIKETPEDAVRVFCDAARSMTLASV